MRKLCALTLLLLHISAFSIASNIDSLKTLVKGGISSNNTAAFIELAKYYELTNTDSSVFIADLAITFAEKHNKSTLLRDALIIKGNALERAGRFPEALETNFKLLKAEEMKNSFEGIAIALNNIGVIYFFQKDFEKAGEYWEKSLSYKIKTGRKKEIADAYVNLGAVKNRLKQPLLAGEMFENALQFYQEIGDSSRISFCYNNLGILYHKLDKTSEKPLGYYLKAYALAEKMGDSETMASTSLNIGVAFYDKNEPVKSVDYLQRSIELAKQNGFKMILIMAYANLAETYAGTNQHKQAYETILIYNTLRDSIMNEDNQSKILALEAKYEAEKKEKKIAEQQHKLAIKQNQMVLAVSALTLLALIASLLAFIYRQKKNAKEALEKAKSKFFSNIVHEFRTPVTLIKGPIEQALEETDNLKSRQNLKIAHSNSIQLLNLVNQLLDVSKLEAGKLTLNPKYGDIVEYISTLHHHFLELAGQKEILLLFSTNISSYYTYFDESSLGKILSNLLSNAIKYSPEKGKVELNIYLTENLEGGLLTLEVKDNGPGIPAHSTEKIFERFYRVSEGGAGYATGTGIGLSLVKELTELNGGEIKVESKTGQGSIFTLILPLKGNLQKAASLYIEEINGSKSAEEKTEILLVEDNLEMREYIKSILNEEGFLITEALNGNDGIEKANDCIPDIIITDIMMPVKDGFGLSKSLKNNELTSHIPIIALTAKAAQEAKLEGLSSGMDVFMTKPFSAKELILNIQNLLKIRHNIQKNFSNSKPAELPAEKASLLNIQDVFIQKIIQKVTANLDDENYGVEQLSDDIAISRSQLHRKLKATTGLSASALMRNIRLEKALALLNSNAGNVSEVAYMTGFSSQSYFTRSFKEYFGFNPTEARQKQQN
jgi:signal transduction histidine kinase/DNA-binding response OmpR family regulator